MRKLEGPVFRHPNPCDLYLGSYRINKKYDLYFCKREVNLIARWGDTTGDEYYSGLHFVRSEPALAMAFALAMVPDSPLSDEERYWLQKKLVHEPGGAPVRSRTSLH